MIGKVGMNGFDDRFFCRMIGFGNPIIDPFLVANFEVVVIKEVSQLFGAGFNSV